MSLNPPLKAGLHLGDQSVRRMSAKQRWGMHREEFPIVSCGKLLLWGRTVPSQLMVSLWLHQRWEFPGRERQGWLFTAANEE